MSEQELTPWFDADVPPVRVGVYEKEFEGRTREYQFWDGKQWLYGKSTPQETMHYVECGKAYPASLHRRWRGLAKEPK